jgi:hypothetical protein
MEFDRRSTDWTKPGTTKALSSHASLMLAASDRSECTRWEPTEPLVKGECEMAEQARMVSVQPQRRVTLPEVSWEGVTEPGAYVEVGSGDLYRIPKEALISGSSPVIRKESAGASRLVQLSLNPFITTLQARLLSCEHNIEPNF